MFSSAGTRRKPGPKGPTQEIISAIVEMKLRNPRFGYQRIAQQISHAFDGQIDKDVVRGVLYNDNRTHRSLNGATSAERAGRPSPPRANFAEYPWRRHCRGLFQTPVAA